MKTQSPGIGRPCGIRRVWRGGYWNRQITLLGAFAMGAMTLLPAGGIAAEVSSETQIARCIHQAAGGRAWLERTLWGLRDQEAGWVGAEVANSNGSHDLGPLQVNSAWVPKIAGMISASPVQVRDWLIHDACFNVKVARWIFLTGLGSSGDYWRAVGIYHSPTGWRQDRYRRLMASKLVGRFGSDVFGRPPTAQKVVQNFK